MPYESLEELLPETVPKIYDFSFNAIQTNGFLNFLSGSKDHVFYVYIVNKIFCTFFMNVHIIIKMISIAFKKTKTGFHPMRIKKKNE